MIRNVNIVKCHSCSITHVPYQCTTLNRHWLRERLSQTVFVIYATLSQLLEKSLSFISWSAHCVLNKKKQIDTNHTRAFAKAASLQRPNKGGGEESIDAEALQAYACMLTWHPNLHDALPDRLTDAQYVLHGVCTNCSALCISVSSQASQLRLATHVRNKSTRVTHFTALLYFTI
jgi:hypothetical protein